MSYATDRRGVYDRSKRLSDRHIRFRACVQRLAHLLGASFHETYGRFARTHGFVEGQVPSEERLLEAMEALDAERAALLDGRAERGA